MHKSIVFQALSVLSVSFFLFSAYGWAQSGTVGGTVGAIVPNAQVEISYPVSGFHHETTSGGLGDFHFSNDPFNPYHLVVTASGFAPYMQDVDVRSSVPVTLQISLKISSESTTVTVEENGGDLVETDPNFHTDVDRKLFDKLPLESQSSSVSSLLTLASPGVVADSSASSTGSATTRKTHFRSTANLSPINRVKYFPARFLSIQSSL